MAPSFIWDDTEGVYRDLSTGQPLNPDPAFLADWGGLPVWRDEFDSPGIDSAKWNARDNEALSYDEAVVYTANNIIPGDGVLYQRIGAIDPPVMRGGRLRAFSTGYLDTIGIFWQKYGRWEIRCKLLVPDECGGYWPSFWLRDQTGPGEIDVFELVGTPSGITQWRADGQPWYTVHENTNGTGEKREATDPRSDYNDGEWHTFALEWTPDAMVFLADGAQVHRVASTDVDWFESSFPSGVNIRLCCQVGASWFGYSDPATYPDGYVTPFDFEVDYVRVWEMP